MAAATDGQRREAETDRAILLRQAEAARVRAAKADTASARADGQADAISFAAAADALVVPSAPRIFADDVTPEAAASLLAEQNGRLAIMSAEGGIFDTMLGRYSNKCRVWTSS
jgi:replicative DNA helicase